MPFKRQVTAHIHVLFGLSSAVRDELIILQQPGGGWVSRYSPEYSTAMALIVLQIPNNVLPIFQR